jgi:hypothetical protein
MPNTASFESFEKELRRLVAKFEQGINEFKNPRYLEAQVRDDFLNPFFSALGWDLENNAGLIQKHREVEIESRTGDGRADYLFRPERKPRFVCEAKKPAEELHGDNAMQAKRYAWTIGLRLAVLSDFEELKIYIVTGNPDKGEPDEGLWRSYHHTEYVAKARELWDLLARDNVAGGSVERLLESLPKKLRPDRTRDFDEEFLAFLDGHRRALASDLIRHNDREDLLEGTKLNEAVQCILDRLLFIRISEARGIDMGTKLQSLLETWKARQEKSDRLREEPPTHWGGSGLGASRGTLWNSIVRHIRALDRRPPSHVPYFNGNLFKIHFSEELVVGDVWLSEFLESISGENSPYKFGYVAVEILGTIYERFLGKIVRPHGRGAVIEEKPEVRKAGGVYYTPRYIVEYIVEQTVGKLLDGKKPEETLKLRFLDPACGSGSFLICVFERVCEHWQQWLVDNPNKRKKNWCWLDAKTNTLHLTVRSKRRILRETIHGVDIDPQAVEVTQLSLYLKMLEGETAETLQREQDFFGGDEPILPPLEDNIKCGNSLIASDFSMMPEDLLRVHAFDWTVQFAPILKAGGFDAVIGNPPWGALLDESELEYLRDHHREIIVRMIDSFMYFTHANVERLKKDGAFGMILPDVMLYQTDTQKLRQYLTDKTSLTHICNMGDVFDQVTRPACIVVCLKTTNPNWKVLVADFAPIPKEEKPKQIVEVKNFTEVEQNRISRVPGCLFTTSGFGNYALWERVSSCPSDKLSDVVDADGIQRGVSPDLKEAFLVSSKIAKEWKLEKQNLRPALTGGKQVKRYDIDRPDLLLIYTGREDYFRRLPNICSYIDQFKKQITCKEVQQKKHSIYSLHRAREEQIFLKPQKLLGVITEDEIVLALDDENTFATDGLYLFGVKPSVDIRYVMAVLNSRLFVSIYRLLSLEEGRALAQVKPTVLANLPIRKIDFKKTADKSRHDRLVLLADKLLGLMPKLRAATSERERDTLQNAVTAADQEIDSLVYDLYGLTEKEIKLVDEAK